jgi:hypothetical protein
MRSGESRFYSDHSKITPDSTALLTVEMKVTIIIDFGMTGSGKEISFNHAATTDDMDAAAAWWSHPEGDNRVDRAPHMIGKIPTKLAYGETGDVVAWGFECEDNKNLDVHESFKMLFNNPTAFSTEDCHGETGPRSFGEVERWCSDYLRQLCRHIIGEITREEGVSQLQLVTEWHLTTPGSVGIILSCLSPVLHLWTSKVAKQ